MPDHPADDAVFAARLARGAGEILVGLAATSGLTGKALGAAGDAEANAWLMAELAQHRPHDGVLCEETQDGPERLARQRVWIIDPLDGTREYGEGRSDWAVHVGLAIDGRAEVGAVALPALGPAPGLVLASDAPPALAPAPAGPVRLLVSRTRPAAEAVAVAAMLGGELVPMGSAGAKAMAVVRGEAEIYLHTGGQFEWDNCAPVAVAAAAGLHVSRVDGTPLVYNRADPALPDLLICRPEWAEQVLAAVRRFGQGGPD